MKTHDTQTLVQRSLTYTVLAAFSLSAGLVLADTRIGRGDFDGDGHDDMLVGIPKEDVGTIRDAGAVSVFYGTGSGLRNEPTHQLHQNTPQSGARAPVHDTAEAYDHFGEVLAIGDFDNDGYDDAAVAVPDEDRGNGLVHIFYGSLRGMHGTHKSVLSMAILGYRNRPGGQFGTALAAGDINGDGYDDLAVGSPYYNLDQADMAGVVMVIYGGVNGLNESGTGQQLLYQRYGFIPGDSEKYDRFGYSLTVNDFDRDGYSDLAVGVPYKGVSRGAATGGVAVLYGSSSGISVLSRPAIFVQDDQADRNSAFGFGLSSGDFDGNGYPDLAVADPYENSLNGAIDAGTVTVIFSDAGGINRFRRQRLSQTIVGVDRDESYDRFGLSLAAADFNRDGLTDLAVGAPHEDYERRFRSDYHDAGQVTVLYGTTTGLQATDRSDWHQDKTGVASSRAEYEMFGYALGSGDFNSDGLQDLVISVPGEDIGLVRGGTQKNAGLVHILYGQPAGLSTHSSLGQEVFVEPINTTGSIAGQAEENDLFGG